MPISLQPKALFGYIFVKGWRASGTGHSEPTATVIDFPESSIPYAKDEDAELQKRELRNMRDMRECERLQKPASTETTTQSKATTIATSVDAPALALAPAPHPDANSKCAQHHGTSLRFEEHVKPGRGRSRKSKAAAAKKTHHRAEHHVARTYNHAQERAPTPPPAPAQARQQRHRSPYPARGRRRQKAAHKPISPAATTTPIPVPNSILNPNPQLSPKPRPPSLSHTRKAQGVATLVEEACWSDFTDDESEGQHDDEDVDVDGDRDGDQVGGADVCMQKHPLLKCPRIGQCLVNERKRKPQAAGARKSALTQGRRRYDQVIKDIGVMEHIEAQLERQCEPSRIQEAKLAELREKAMAGTRVSGFMKEGVPSWGFDVMAGGCGGTSVFGTPLMPVYRNPDGSRAHFGGDSDLDPW
ncbi:hypothetical protein F4808DRAFT_456850 [Astrocystis sublimbata]|nr:hypothetical protein F4808DRAFT_456850 [Astrocystis sublimbata]